jgi:5-methylcytosine-specific restriction endonuclease McrA
VLVCEPPIIRGALKGQTATGTAAGYMRHRNAGEPPCSRCVEGKRRTDRENSKEWRQRHPGYHLVRYRLNPEPFKLRRAEWRRENPDLARRLHRDYVARNRARINELARLRVARKRDVLTIQFTPEQLADRMAYWGNKCWMCGGNFEAVDHVIPISLGGPHCLSNLRPSCGSCNSAKGNRPWKEYAA